MSVYFSPDEEKFYLWFRAMRDPIVRPFILFFNKIGITPNMLTLFGLLMLIPFVYFFFFNPWISFLFLILNLFFDGVDGSLARFLKKDSSVGEFLDKGADYFSFIVVFFTFLYFGMLSPFWAAAHVLNYALMQSFVMFAQIRKINIFPILRPKFIIYFFFIVWIFTGQNFFDPVLVVLTVYLIVSNLFLFLKIKSSIR